MPPLVNRDDELRALLDVTRRLAPEEIAELQLEQGYFDHALRIYDELARRDPSNASYATRRAWLARMLAPARDARWVDGPNDAPDHAAAKCVRDTKTVLVRQMIRVVDAR